MITNGIDYKKKINLELEDIKRKYFKVQNITQDYENEISMRDEYADRQFFELLQNADDAYDSSNSVSMRIICENDKIIIQNSGIPFSFDEGIMSLLYSRNSMKRNKIGQKGLGFRSILNWTNRFQILTSDFGFEWNEENKSSFYQEIIQMYPKLKEKLESKYKNVIPLATLVCPNHMSDETILSIVEKYNKDNVYATTIILFLEPKLLERVENELNELNFKLLMFLKHIDTIDITLADGKTKTIQKMEQAPYIYITTKIDNSIVKEKSFFFRRELKTIDEGNTYEYMFAYDLDDNERQLYYPLYCYFPTDEIVPYPFIIHGTFSLNSSRKNLIAGSASPVNQLILSTIAKDIGNFAVELSLHNKEVSYKPLSILLGTTYSHLSNYIVNSGYPDITFNNIITNSIENLKIFPCLSKTYLSIKDGLIFIPHRNISFFEAEDFSNVLLYPPNETIETFLKHHTQIGRISALELAQSITKSGKYHDITKVSKICVLFENLFSNIEDRPKILINYINEVIDQNQTIFLLPEESQNINIPVWVKSNFTYLNKELEENLILDFSLKFDNDKSGPRSRLISILAKYGGKPYTFINVFDEVVKTIDFDEDRIDFVKWLLNEYSSKRFTSLPPDRLTKVLLRSKSGEFAEPTKLYFDIDYGNEYITSLNLPLSCIVQKYDFDNFDRAQIIEFFRILNVGEKLRFVSKVISRNDEQFRALSIYESLEKNNVYPIQTNNEPINNSEEGISKIASISIKVPDVFDYIIKSDSQSVILSYLAHHGQDMTNEFSCAGFNMGGNTRSNRYASVKYSYTLDLIRKTKWIKTLTKSYSPREIIISNHLKEHFSEHILGASREELQKLLGLDFKQVRFLISQLDIAEQYYDLSEELIKKLLTNLYLLDPTGIFAPSLYRSIVVDNKKEKPREMLRNFPLFCKDKMYHDNLKEIVFYEDTKLPISISSKLFIVDLGRKQSKKKSKNWLNVDHYTYDGFVEKYELSKYNADFTTVLNDIKIALVAHRIGDASETEVNKISKFSLTLCSSLQDNNSNSLDDFDYLTSKDNDNSYFVKLPVFPNIKEIEASSKFQETIASIFQVLLNLDSSSVFNLFARLVSSSRKNITVDQLGESVWFEAKQRLFNLTLAEKKNLDTQEKINVKTRKLLSEHLAYKDLYQKSLFRTLVKQNWDEQKKYFDLINIYINYRDYKISESDLEKSNFELIKEHFSIIDKKCDTEYLQRLFNNILSDFKIKFPEEKDESIISFLELKDNNLRALFGYNDYLLNLYKSLHSKDSLNIFENVDAQETSKNYVVKTIINDDIENIEISNRHLFLHPKADSESSKVKTEKSKTLNGIKAEKAVFEKYYQMSNLTRWVSSFAKRDKEYFGYNSQGNDAYGCDIEFIFLNELGERVVTYIEVKHCSIDSQNNMEFYITEREIQFSKDYDEMYLLILVVFNENTTVGFYEYKHPFCKTSGKKFVLNATDYIVKIRNPLKSTNGID